jgi:lysine 2,3-aminomutase
VGEEDKTITDRQLKDAINYIKQNSRIHDVLISGGDPLVLDTDRLESIISALRGIRHVEIIRIGTRVHVVMPRRIDEKLLEKLSKYHPIWINTHLNHPNEITSLSRRACEIHCGCRHPLGNQSVLLKVSTTCRSHVAITAQSCFNARAARIIYTNATFQKDSVIFEPEWKRE